MIEYRDVCFSYRGGPAVLEGVRLAVHEGEMLLVIGSSGSGKSTLLRCANGLVPHSTGGRFGGEVLVCGSSTRDHPPRALAGVVGFVHQDPEAQFVVDRVEADVAFVLENLGLEAFDVRRRVDESLEAVGIAHLRERSPATLSGGEQQRCALAGALAASPAALVLDEPTSQLDPEGADAVIAAIGRLNADHGTTVLVAEHRLERAAPLAGRTLAMGSAPGPTGEVVASYAGAPSVTRLGRLLGWQPLPLTVDEAREQAARDGHLVPGGPPREMANARGNLLIEGQDLRVEIRGKEVLHGITVDLREGDVLALLGRNGSGKTTLLRALSRLVESSGSVAGEASVAYVPQDPNSLLFSSTVRREVGETLRLLGRRDAVALERWIDALGLAAVADRHPRSLSSGERQRVAVAAVAVGGARVLLLDEPTRGMDALSRAALERAVRDHAERGGAVVLATHDVELAARCATRVLILEGGQAHALGDPREVLAGSPFAPQVLRVFPPYLTVEEVAEVVSR